MPAPRSLLTVVVEILTCLRFYTRLPLPMLAIEVSHAPAFFSRCLRWAPLAGFGVGLCGAAALAAGSALGLPVLVCATLALPTMVLVGGGLHEDGLADVADGFGGGSTPQRKLAIMRDSRLGTYAALAIVVSLMLRAAALAGLVERDGIGIAMAALIAAASASRGLGLMPMALLLPARSDGLGHGAGRLPAGVFAVATALAVTIGLSLPVFAGTGLARPALALLLAALAAAWMTRLARRQIGGFTGDVAGACQQLCDVTLLLGLLIGAPTR